MQFDIATKEECASSFCCYACCQMLQSTGPQWPFSLLVSYLTPDTKHNLTWVYRWSWAGRYPGILTVSWGDNLCLECHTFFITWLNMNMVWWQQLLSLVDFQQDLLSLSSADEVCFIGSIKLYCKFTTCETTVFLKGNSLFITGTNLLIWIFETNSLQYYPQMLDIFGNLMWLLHQLQMVKVWLFFIMTV